eukprot:TRINITY_DN7043_c0_g1_i1.p1 TRINITY_DN7043_c0_g1~~TRINITY_DN7043_c0_g1_i1.p1  ORF type:complete len:968 (+),score=193.03 TRINITY_DN7043_c0_g1_i1:362-3265(+)
MLVLTDVGEEIDDEAALWLLIQHLSAAPDMEADVVFVTGVPMQRATRWATIINSQAVPKRISRLRYFAGPQSGRHMRYRTFADAEALLEAGIADIIQRPFLGGQYDVVLQLSPLGGFHEDSFGGAPPEGVKGSLARVEPRPGSKGPLHIIVGGVGATNYPRDQLHFGFQEALQKKGFRTVHVEKSNYMNWQTAMFETFPPKLVEVVLDDEWNKAVGRIPPFVANQLVRFRVNTLVNYDVVDRAFAAFEHDLRSTPSFVKATDWWARTETEVTKLIKEGYVKMMRAADSKSNDSFGNVQISEKVKGMKFTWESVMSRTCIRDVFASTSVTEKTLSGQLVDDILCYAVVLITSKLLKIYAFNRYISDREPEMSQLEPYLCGTKETPPLDFRNFPSLHGDMSSIQKEVVGNPMYDPAGMLVALVAMGASEAQVQELATKLQEQKALLGEDQKLEAMKAVYKGEEPQQLNRRFFEAEKPADKIRGTDVTRVLVLTDAGNEADQETALWMLSKHVACTKELEIDVVFTTGNPPMHAMRWAAVLNSLGRDPPGQQHMHYFIGPETHHEMRYFVKLDDKELAQAGMSDLKDRPFDGGQYSIVLQASPLSGFSDNFAAPPAGPAGALGRLQVLEGKEKPVRPVYIVVGEEGSVNFPKDAMHQAFKKTVIERGFNVIHVSSQNYVNWSAPVLASLPSALTNLAMQDEWNKAVGRIPPSAANLLIRFRVNVSVNYTVVDRAYNTFVERNASSESFTKSLEWWKEIAPEIHQAVMNNYVKASRAQDGKNFGNPKIKEVIKGQKETWRTVMSDTCVKDIVNANGLSEAGLLEKSVDDVMGLAVTEITGKLLRFYAYSAFDSKVTPNKSLCIGYVSGSTTNPPLDFFQFPRLLSDFGPVKKMVAGNPMYDSSAVLILMALLQASKDEADFLIEHLSSQKSLLSASLRNDLMSKICKTGDASNLAVALCSTSEDIISRAAF